MAVVIGGEHPASSARAQGEAGTVLVEDLTVLPRPVDGDHRRVESGDRRAGGPGPLPAVAGQQVVAGPVAGHVAPHADAEVATTAAHPSPQERRLGLDQPPGRVVVVSPAAGLDVERCPGEGGRRDRDVAVGPAVEDPHRRGTRGEDVADREGAARVAGRAQVDECQRQR